MTTADDPRPIDPLPRRDRLGRLDAAILLVLLLGVAIVFGPSVGFPFVNYDDQDYVFENGPVKDGLTWAGLRWALTTGHAANWHPLTWLSHMVDVTCFGLWAGGHHFTNVLLHAANAALLYVALRRLTGRLWPAAFVAAVFAWHPLRAESVAWVSERKDVLSTFFGLLALIAYERYARRGPRATLAYVLTLVCLALSLMAKQMFVTFPFLLLLLDVWPLRRIELDATWRRRVGPLLIDKLPMLGLVALAATATFVFQSSAGAMMADAQIGLGPRLANATVSVVRYLRLLFAPYGLAAYYPHPYALPGGFIPAWQIAGAAATIAAISASVVLHLRRRPWLAVGWFWFLGTLVPVVGIVQVGNQALADRYTYWPAIGVTIAVAYGLAELAATAARRKSLALVAGLACAALLPIGYRQVGFWRDSLTLMKRGADVVPDSFSAVNSLGAELERANDIPGAEAAYRRAIAILPNDPAANTNLAGLLIRAGRLDEAAAPIEVAMRSDPTNASVHVALADLQLARGDVDRGFASYERATKLRPNDRRIFHQYALALAERGRLDEAVRQWRAALAIDAHYAAALDGLGRAMLVAGDARDGHDALRRAIAIDPTLDNAAYTLAWSLATNADVSLRDARESARYARLALARKPDHPLYLDALAAAAAISGRFDEAQAIATRAEQIARAAGQSAMADAIGGRAARYRERAGR